jgi:hypothetical protein
MLVTLSLSIHPFLRLFHLGTKLGGLDKLGMGKLSGMSTIMKSTIMKSTLVRLFGNLTNQRS